MINSNRENLYIQLKSVPNWRTKRVKIIYAISIQTLFKNLMFFFKSATTQQHLKSRRNKLKKNFFIQLQYNEIHKKNSINIGNNLMSMGF